MNMIKRLFAFSLVLFLATLGATLGAPLGQAATTPLTPKMVSGEVVSVDSAKNEVVIKDSASAEVRIVVNESTKLTKGDKSVSLTDLKPGEKVAIEVDEAEGKLVAKSIAVTTE
ncbi:MAG: hypothetical protein J2P52_11510 [Blastocatellia bacterium]|nr:hypothetical protein [Blastocatellia bacterium]